MFGEIQYGGRVTDDYDKRLLNTFCKVWFREEMFGPAFTYHKVYVIPRCAKLQEYFDYINGLPSYDTPEVFGLHPNADITSVQLFCLTSSFTGWKAIMLLQT
jgi:dynein heavy chain